MHEMSLAESLLQMAVAEAGEQGCDKLLKVRVEYGPIAGIMPEALELCFEALIKDSRHSGAKLEMARLPLRLRCVLCGAEFTGNDREDIWKPCPACGEVFGHTVLQGRELLLARIEACKSGL